MKKKFEPIKSSQQANKESRALKTIWSQESHLTQRILIYCAELLEGMQRKTRQRKQSGWNKFFAAGMKAGKSPALIADEWRSSKRR